MTKQVQNAIAIDDVYKNFKLPHEKQSSLKDGFVNIFNKTTKTTEVQQTLKGISFNVEEGEFFGIVGRNGSGKSTLLKIIAGIYKPTQGSVTVNGRLVPFIELGVGFNPELTGRENVYLNGALMGFSSVEVDRKLDAIIAFSELERFMDQKLKNYSSGMQVRLAFSVATILAESDILLIDEVLAVGDADFQRKCFDYFKELKKNKKTVIFVSHDMSAVREYCDRAILIEGGEIVHQGTSEDVSKEYTRLFLPKSDTTEEEPASLDLGDDNKWGAGGLDIINLATDKKSYVDTDDSITVSYTIVADSYKGQIIPGFTIKDPQGRALAGTNSRVIMSKDVPEITRKNQKVKVSWTMPNVLTGGVYTVEPAVLSGENETLLWWDEALRFRVSNEEDTPHLISPTIHLSVK